MNSKKSFTIGELVFVVVGVIFLFIAVYYTIVAFYHKEPTPIQGNLAELVGISNIMTAFMLRFMIKR